MSVFIGISEIIGIWGGVVVGLIKMIVMSPYLNLVAGLILFASGVSESLQDYQDMGGLYFGIHHGVTLFSLVQILKTIPELFEGLKYISHAEE